MTAKWVEEAWVEVPYRRKRGQIDVVTTRIKLCNTDELLKFLQVH